MSVSIESDPTAPGYRLFVGVDIAAATLTAVWTAPAASPSRPLTLDQTPGGFTPNTV
jgi:transposase